VDDLPEAGATDLFQDALKVKEAFAGILITGARGERGNEFRDRFCGIGRAPVRKAGRMTQDVAGGDDPRRGVREVVDVGDERAVEIELTLGAEGESSVGRHLLREAGGLKKGRGGDWIRRSGGADAKREEPRELVAVKDTDNSTGQGSCAHQPA
jgi:hypothetical protein